MEEQIALAAMATCLSIVEDYIEKEYLNPDTEVSREKTKTLVNIALKIEAEMSGLRNRMFDSSYYIEEHKTKTELNWMEDNEEILYSQYGPEKTYSDYNVVNLDEYRRP